MEITVQELKEKMDKGDDFLLLDVREPYEYKEFNIGAELIPLGQVTSRLDELEGYKNKEVIIHCRSGARSATAQRILINAGFKDVKNLVGGMLAWYQAFHSPK